MNHHWRLETLSVSTCNSTIIVELSLTTGGNPQLLPYYEPEPAAAVDDSEMACEAEPAVGPPVLMRFTNEVLFEIFRTF